MTAWSRIACAFRAWQARRQAERLARPTGRCAFCGNLVYGPAVRRGYRQELLCVRCTDAARTASTEQGP